MLRLLLLLLLLGVIVAMALLAMRGQPAETHRHRLARVRVQRAADLAWDHDEISEALAGAIIERTRGLRPDLPVEVLEQAVEDVLHLAREHREQEPALATIVIDTLRDPELG